MIRFVWLNENFKTLTIHQVSSNISSSMTKFQRGDAVRKIKGSQWSGLVVGEYSTTLTPEGYAVESFTEKGSVQIYPASALEKMDVNVNCPSCGRTLANEVENSFDDWCKVCHRGRIDVRTK